MPVRSTPQRTRRRKRRGKNREGCREASLKFPRVFRDSVHLLAALLCGCLRMFTYILDKCWLGVCVFVCVHKRVCWCLAQTAFITQRVSTCPLFMSALQMSPFKCTLKLNPQNDKLACARCRQKKKKRKGAKAAHETPKCCFRLLFKLSRWQHWPNVSWCPVRGLSGQITAPLTEVLSVSVKVSHLGFEREKKHYFIMNTAKM